MTSEMLEDGLQLHHITFNIQGADASTRIRRYVSCTDTLGNTSETELNFRIIIPMALDTQAPVVSVNKIGSLPPGTAGVSLVAHTNEAAKCTYAPNTKLLPSLSINNMNSIDKLKHTVNLIGLSENSYSYKIICTDMFNNISKPSVIEFEITAESKKKHKVY
jgi:hypothetical protein